MSGRCYRPIPANLTLVVFLPLLHPLHLEGVCSQDRGQAISHPAYLSAYSATYAGSPMLRERSFWRPLLLERTKRSWRPECSVCVQPEIADRGTRVRWV